MSSGVLTEQEMSARVKEGMHCTSSGGLGPFVVPWVIGESVKRRVRGWMELLNNDQKIRAIIEGE